MEVGWLEFQWAQLPMSSAYMYMHMCGFWGKKSEFIERKGGGGGVEGGTQLKSQAASRVKKKKGKEKGRGN